MTRMSDEKALALATMLVRGFADAIREAGPDGAPAGPLYAASMSFLSLHQFETIMDALVTAGKIRKSGHVYYHVN